ncbi:MAG: hypothetical protein AB7E31_05285 [Desulfitobacterium sp.]
MSNSVGSLLNFNQRVGHNIEMGLGVNAAWDGKTVEFKIGL